MKLEQTLCRFWTLEPVHVGTGQENRGEVDLPVSRETGSNVPDWPGSTLKGMFRAHADWQLRCRGTKTTGCPGQSPMAEDEKPRHKDCGVTECPICQTFGYPAGKYRNKDNELLNRPGREGRVFFKDGRLAFFPAATNRGIYWFTTPGRAAAYLDPGSELSADPLHQRFPELLFAPGRHAGFAVNGQITEIRVAWFQLSKLTDRPNSELEKKLLKYLRGNKAGSFPSEAIWQELVRRTIIVDETSFGRIVDSCLERRTRNKIDELTGTVQSGALFNYEALPRYCLLYARLEWQPWAPDRQFAGLANPLAVCELAREGLARMGLGGMQTTGLGSVLLQPFTREQR